MMFDPCITAKVWACANVWTRVTFWPAFLTRELLLLPQRFPLDEPASEQEVSSVSRKVKQRQSGTWEGAAREAIDALWQPSGIVPLRRFEHSWRRSWLLLYESAVFYVTIGLLELFGVDVLLHAFKPELSWLYSAATGTLWQLQPARDKLAASDASFAQASFSGLVPTSVINTGDPNFMLPYDAASQLLDIAARWQASSHLQTVNGSSGNGNISSPAGSATAGCTSGVTQPDHVQTFRLGSANGFSASKHEAAALSESRQDLPASCQTQQNFLAGNAAAGQLSLQDAHLLCMCSKLVYEAPAIIEHVLGRWGLQLKAFHSLPAHLSTACGYVPDITWFVAGTADATIVAFRGADPFTQVSRRSDVPTAKTVRPGMGGVLDGFYRSFFHKRTSSAPLLPPRLSNDVAASGRLPDNIPASSNQSLNGSGSRPGSRGKHVDRPRCEYDVLCAALDVACGEGAPLLLTGHSIGGALAAVFAQALHARSSPLADRIAGICTFGQPRTGDAAFAAVFNKRFGNRALRFTHGTDMVPELPTVFAGYAHHGSHRHIASWPLQTSSPGRIIAGDETAQLAAVVAAEDRWSLPLGIMKLLAALWRQESIPKMFSRLALLPLPGIADHFPSEYEMALRDAL